jgi:uncharacterized membrane protein YhaH (DUF805 family)
MKFWSVVGSVFLKSLHFSGRARRTEYWLFFFFVIIGGWVCNVADRVFFDVEGRHWPFFIGFSLVTLIPSLAVSVRRLHDTNHSGWWTILGYPASGATLYFIVAFEIVRPLVLLRPDPIDAIASGFKVIWFFAGDLYSSLMGEQSGDLLIQALWATLASLVTVVWGCVVLIWFFSRGTNGDNRFGPDPAASNIAEVFA